MSIQVEEGNVNSANPWDFFSGIIVGCMQNVHEGEDHAVRMLDMQLTCSYALCIYIKAEMIFLTRALSGHTSMVMGNGRIPAD
jgi:hypothetical protein